MEVPHSRAACLDCLAYHPNAERLSVTHRPARSNRPPYRGACICTIFTCWLLLLGGQAFAASPPKIERESFSITGNLATLTVTIRPNGLTTTYAVWVQRPGCPGPGVKCLIVTAKRIAKGEIAGAADAFSLRVSVDSASNTWTKIGISARSSAGETLGHEHTAPARNRED